MKTKKNNQAQVSQSMFELAKWSDPAYFPIVNQNTNDYLMSLSTGTNAKVRMSDFLVSANNFSDVSDVSLSRQNLSVPQTTVGVNAPGLLAGNVGDIYFDSVANISYTCTNVSPITWAPTSGSASGDLLSANNLSDVQSLSTSRLNLSVPKVSNGLGSPNGSIAGEVNDEYFDQSTDPSTFWRCKISGNPGVWEIPETNALNIVSSNFGEINFQGNTTQTTFLSVGSPVKINGTYNDGLLQNFTHSNGRLTCTASGVNVYDIKVSTTGSLLFASDSITLFISVNGSAIAQSAQSVNLDGVSPSFKSISLQKLVSLSQGDYVEVWVQNNNSTNAVVHQDISLIVGSPGAVGSPTPTLPTFPGFRQIAPVTITNTTVGILNSTGVGSFTIPANSLTVGDTLVLEFAGRISPSFPSPQSSMFIALNAGLSYQIFNTPNYTRSTISNYSFRAVMTVRAVGGPGVANLQIAIQTINLDNIASGGNTSAVLSNNSTTFSTLSNINLQLIISYVAAFPDNTFTVETLTLTKL